MPSLADFITFVIASLIIIVIPGPSVVFSVGRTLALGRPAGLATVIGNAVGTSVWVLFAAFGLAGLLQLFPPLIDIVKIIGALYLAYLGVQTIRSSGNKHAEITEQNQTAKSVKQIFREGFTVGLANPKVAVFFTAVLPQFINPEGNFIIQFLLLGLIFEVLGVIGDSTYVIAAAYVRNWILTVPARLTRIVSVGGMMIVGLALWLLIEAAL
ncbi:MAG: hypothetical protein RI933_583 [Actinomycetota bacterium]